MDKSGTLMKPERVVRHASTLSVLVLQMKAASQVLKESEQIEQGPRKPGADSVNG